MAQDCATPAVDAAGAAPSESELAAEQLRSFKERLALLRRGGQTAADAEETASALAGGDDPEAQLREFRERQRKDFHLKEYWEMRYAGRPEASEDWLCVWGDVKEMLLPTEDFEGWVRPSDRVLTLGCGNSTMPGEMFLDGIRSQVATDYSKVVVDQMQEAYPEAFLRFACSRDADYGVPPHEEGQTITWLEADATRLSDTFEPGQFDVVVAKTLLDTLLCSPQRDVLVDAYWTSVWDVLSEHGRFVSLDLHPQDAVVGWLDHWSRKHKRSWKVYAIQYDVLSRVPAGMRGKVRHACFVAVKDGTLP
eukprot:TRINITY_DN66680_c0_g1_i1.p1 TRINITY_DN66680_c0_g1~~TRINITY_DN66680_c0_g1_i1.p1  ORF type:complete len:339 (+),score=93.31 TRINITY_DN66680_c0_g1_i1:99-1019(+)